MRTVTSFDATSTTDQVLDGFDLRGMRVLVTGVSAGLGIETARALAAHGATVIGTARDLVKADRATRQVQADAASGGGSFSIAELDLASFASIRACSEALVADGLAFDLVIANAGVMATPFGLTVDGFETQLGTNYLGHFLFVNRIARLMRTGSRLVMLSSAGHRYGTVDLDDPNFQRLPYEAWHAYGRSKTANVLFAVEFDRRHRDAGIRATALHPGGIDTELGRHAFKEPGELQLKVADINAQRKAAGHPPLALKSVAQGAATSVWAGIVADADEIGGRYCEDCGVADVVDAAAIIGGGVMGYALDAEHARALWDRSEHWVGERF
ncbi:SDR family NAD(P)-dependent oxidoreductase [soil metagenome]